MKKRTLYLKIFFSTITLILGCNSKAKKYTMENLTPPIADIIPHQHKIHNQRRIDNYYWLKERRNPEVVDYLKRENDYYKKKTIHSIPLQEELYIEMRERIKEDDNSVPYFFNGYWYITRFEENKDYPIYSRKKEKLTSKEEIILDCNKMAKGHAYFDLVGVSVSPDNTKVAFGIDTISRRQYTIQIKNLLTNEILKNKIENTTGGCVWAADNKSLFYNKKNPQTLRSEAILKHNINLPDNNDKIVYHEKDETFSVYVSKSKSQEYLLINSVSTLTSESRFIKATSPDDEFKVFQKRIVGMEYSLDHFGNHFYIYTNYNKAKNFKIMRTSVNKTTKEYWEDLLPHRKHTLIEDFDLFEKYWVVNERENGLSRLRVIHWDGSSDYYLPMNDETYTLYMNNNPDFKSNTFRYIYNSMTTPASVIEYNTANKETFILKTQEILGGKFNKENYNSKRLWADGRDGKKIPISLVHHKDTELNQHTPILLYAYGSYGSTIDPSFSSSRLSLLDRGFAFAIAHIRGGEYLGRQWYEEGKLLNKKNTFQDFVDCSKFLIEKQFTSPEHLYAYGGSAGGLLMGAVINMAPELYNGVIAAVPFVDVVTTMLDETIPLTTSEFDEWGNPKYKKYYDYMLSYSPYDQIKPMNYPNLLVTSGFHDSQVQYFEPTKWVAKLRSMKTDNNYLFLYTNMKAGHSGASGRFDGLKELAKKYAFLIDLEEK